MATQEEWKAIVSIKLANKAEAQNIVSLGA